MGLSWKERVFMALLGVATASGLIVLILILVEATNVLLPADTKFGIVFDAGSSHTSLFVYQWPANKEKNTGVVSQAMTCEIEGPGISSYTSDPTQAGESLRGCLEKALALVPKAQHQETPTFLGATAGMRLLSQKNSSQARDILAAVSQVLSESPVDFWGAKILAGRDEGAFGWITINYVLGMLLKYSSGEWILPEEGMLVGALDLGGASTQISFVPRGSILDQSTQATFLLYGANYSIYTHSYLCFGRDQVLNRLLAGLAQRSSMPWVRHPCYHRGYQATLPLATLYESPCVHTTESLNLTQNITVEGTGNPGECMAALQDLFNFSSCQGREDCAFNGVYQPPVHGQFYAGTAFSPPPGLLQLLLHLPLPEPHLQAATEPRQCHYLEVLPGILEHGRGQLSRAGTLAAGLLCLRPVHPHAAARGLQIQRGDLAQHPVSEAGWRHGHWLDPGLHAEPYWHDSSRGTSRVAGSELWHLDSWSSVCGADPCGHSWGSCSPALLVLKLGGGQTEIRVQAGMCLKQELS